MPGPTSDFDPATHGWQPYGEGFIGLVGPLWRRGGGEDARYGFLAHDRHLNSAGNVHGGMLMTFIDDVLAAHVRQCVNSPGQATVQLNTHFAGPVRSGDFVEALCQIVHRNRTIVFVRAICHVGDRTVAAADGIWRLFDKRL